MGFALETGEQITLGINKLITEIAPSAAGRPMYGGIIYELEPGNSVTAVCGHFIYKAHVSLEFSKGYLLDDPSKHLEGSGKYRRHLKLRDIGDIEELAVATYLQQAFSLPQA